MAKTIIIDTSFLGEEFTLKLALKSYIEKNQAILKDLKKIYGKDYIPNQHLNIAAIKNCRLLLKKLETK